MSNTHISLGKTEPKHWSEYTEVVGMRAQLLLEQLGTQMALHGKPMNAATLRISLPSGIIGNVMQCANVRADSALVQSFLTNDDTRENGTIDIVRLKALAQYKGIGPLPAQEQQVGN